MPTGADGYDGLSSEHRFGQLIRDQRKRLGVSQDAVSQQLRAAGWPLTQAQVSKAEAGERPLRLDEATAFCRVLSLDPADAISAAVDGAAGGSAKLAERTAWQDLLHAERA